MSHSTESLENIELIRQVHKLTLCIMNIKKRSVHCHNKNDLTGVPGNATFPTLSQSFFKKTLTFQFSKKKKKKPFLTNKCVNNDENITSTESINSSDDTEIAAKLNSFLWMLEKFKHSIIWGSISDGKDTTLKTWGKFKNHRSSKLIKIKETQFSVLINLHFLKLEFY